jgi:retron-type reverse transcriptase
MTVLLFMTQIKNRDTPIEVECAFKGKVIFCVRGVASPLLANVYLHYVFDLWANRWRQREATGDMIIVRYADDSVPRTY